jgi:flagellar biosynthesis protein FlhF
MRIKRFVAGNIREAMRRVREEQGPQAVILSTTTVPDGVEVVTAMDYDQKRVHDAVIRTVTQDAGCGPLATPDKRPQVNAATPASSGSGAESKAVGTDSKRRGATSAGSRKAKTERKTPAGPKARRAKSTRKTATNRTRKQTPSQPVVAAGSQIGAPVATPRRDQLSPAPGAEMLESLAPAMTGIRRDLDGLRETLEVQLASLAWNDLNRHQPGRAGVLRQLARMDIDADVANRIVEKIPAGASVADVSRLPLELLAQHLAVADRRPEEFAGVVALVGPTGAGKTTTAAKLAAHAVIHHGADRVAFVSTDHYRIGGAARLDRYALLLGVPVYQASDPHQLRRLLRRLADHHAVVVDGVGMAPEDPQLAAQMATLEGAGKALSTLLVLPACAHPGTLQRAVLAYRSLQPAGCILTKLDEAPLVGGAISVLIRHQLELQFTTDGQGIPDDIATPDLAGLLQRANAEQTTWDDEGMVAHEYCGLPAGAMAPAATVAS